MIKFQHFNYSTLTDSHNLVRLITFCERAKSQIEYSCVEKYFIEFYEGKIFKYYLLVAIISGGNTSLEL